MVAFADPDMLAPSYFTGAASAPRPSRCSARAIGHVFCAREIDGGSCTENCTAWRRMKLVRGLSERSSWGKEGRMNAVPVILKADTGEVPGALIAGLLAELPGVTLLTDDDAPADVARVTFTAPEWQCADADL